MPTEPLLFLVGPTASGKSRLALSVAPTLNAEILSMDSMSVYSGMDVGTAKPTVEDRRKLKHHLIDRVTPKESFSVADYVRAAEEALRELADRGRRGLFVGGTALYMKALISGLFEGPAADEALRTELAMRADSEGAEALHAELREVDPDAAERIHPNDLKRIVRAIEIYQLTGKPISALQKQWNDAKSERPHVIVGLDWDRQILYERIDRRVEQMFCDGLVEEVESLIERFGRLGPTACKALGYAETLQHLAGKLTRSETVELVQRHSRQFAKRQLTWLRQFSEIKWVKMSSKRNEPAAAEEIIAMFGGDDGPFGTEPD